MALVFARWGASIEFLSFVQSSGILLEFIKRVSDETSMKVVPFTNEHENGVDCVKAIHYGKP